MLCNGAETSTEWESESVTNGLTGVKSESGEQKNNVINKNTALLLIFFSSSKSIVDFRKVKVLSKKQCHKGKPKHQNINHPQYSNSRYAK